MIRKIICLATLVLISFVTMQLSFSSQSELQKIYRFKNGFWFNGSAFVKKDMFVRDGMFIRSATNAADSVIDLNGMYIIPPFAEAHTHILEGVGNVDERIRNYLNDGVFYVKNPNNVLEWTKSIFSKINTPSSLDASFANAGITGPGGHPESIYEDNVRQHLKQMGKDVERGWFKDKAYYSVANAEDIEQIWPKILSGKPDFIKIYLSNSDLSAAQIAAAPKKMRTGLDPALAQIIVNKAHAAGLRVTAHIETANDFRNAAQMKVDEINHTPGFYIMSKDSVSRYMLTAADANLAAKNNVYVVTALLSRDLLDDASLLPEAKKVQASNLALLYKNGVKLAIGSDHAMSPVQEITALDELKIFDNLARLKLWCESTPATIFPKRKLGFLKEGYEANFLVIKGDPLADWKHTGAILSRVKKGKYLDL
ncbi:MAG TPA: amidohydrolase family protein [Chitinophagaceae bacterium]